MRSSIEDEDGIRAKHRDLAENVGNSVQFLGGVSLVISGPIEPNLETDSLLNDDLFGHVGFSML